MCNLSKKNTDNLANLSKAGRLPPVGPRPRISARPAISWRVTTRTDCLSRF